MFLVSSFMYLLLRGVAPPVGPLYQHHLLVTHTAMLGRLPDRRHGLFQSGPLLTFPGTTDSFLCPRRGRTRRRDHGQHRAVNHGRQDSRYGQLIGPGHADRLPVERVLAVAEQRRSARVKMVVLDGVLGNGVTALCELPHQRPLPRRLHQLVMCSGSITVILLRPPRGRHIHGHRGGPPGAPTATLGVGSGPGGDRMHHRCVSGAGAPR